MNFLRSALCLGLAGGFGIATAQEGDYDHESLTMTQGQVYREIHVMGADATGLTFRHREGIAKAGDDLLSPSYRSLYEPVEVLPGVEGEPVTAPVPKPMTGLAGIEGPIVITLRQQVRIPWRRCQAGAEGPATAIPFSGPGPGVGWTIATG